MLGVIVADGLPHAQFHWVKSSPPVAESVSKKLSLPLLPLLPQYCCSITVIGMALACTNCASISHILKPCRAGRFSPDHYFS
jgi:hypothetical protein